MAIHAKPNGKYQVNMLDKYNIRIKRTFSRKADAQAFAALVTKEKYETKLINNRLKSQRYSIQDALHEFESSKQHLRPKSVSKYGNVIKQIRYFLEHKQIRFLDEFTPDHATEFYRLLTKPRKVNEFRTVVPKPKTVNFYIQTLKSFFNVEVEKNHLQRNPAIHIKNLKVEKPKPEYYTEDEIKAFFAIEMHEAYRLAFLGLLYTGMRFGELANVKWSDLDLSKKLIYVRSSETFKAKTENSERAIPIADQLYDILKEAYHNRQTEYVFPSPLGKQLRERRLLQVCKKIGSQAGITSRLYLHKFRHTTATHLIQRGVPIEAIKEILGHWSVTETEIYAHHKADHLHDYMNKISI